MTEIERDIDVGNGEEEKSIMRERNGRVEEEVRRRRKGKEG